MKVEIKKISGEKRKIETNKHFVCPGSFEDGLKASAKSAFKMNVSEDIDRDLCSLCYLCKLRDDRVFLDEDFYPVFKSNEKDKKSYNISNESKLQFQTELAAMGETVGISKWLAILLITYGFDETYIESSISKETVPKDIIALFNLFPGGTYSKPKRVDIECFDDENLFVFENKKFDAVKKDVKEAIGQICAYASSSIYQNKKKKYFILSYNGARQLAKDKIEKDLNTDEYFAFKRIFSKKDYNFCVIPSSKFFDIICDSLKTNKKDKRSIVNLIKSCVIDL